MAAKRWIRFVCIGMATVAALLLGALWIQQKAINSSVQGAEGFLSGVIRLLATALLGAPVLRDVVAYAVKILDRKTSIVPSAVAGAVKSEDSWIGRLAASPRGLLVSSPMAILLAMAIWVEWSVPTGNVPRAAVSEARWQLPDGSFVDKPRVYRRLLAAGELLLVGEEPAALVQFRRYAAKSSRTPWYWLRAGASDSPVTEPESISVNVEATAQTLFGNELLDGERFRTPVRLDDAALRGSLTEEQWSIIAAGVVGRPSLRGYRLRPDRTRSTLSISAPTLVSWVDLDQAVTHFKGAMTAHLERNNLSLALAPRLELQAERVPRQVVNRAVDREIEQIENRRPDTWRGARLAALTVAELVRWGMTRVVDAPDLDAAASPANWRQAKLERLRVAFQPRGQDMHWLCRASENRNVVQSYLTAVLVAELPDASEVPGAFGAVLTEECLDAYLRAVRALRWAEELVGTDAIQARRGDRAVATVIERLSTVAPIVPSEELTNQWRALCRELQGHTNEVPLATQVVNAFGGMLAPRQTACS